MTELNDLQIPREKLVEVCSKSLYTIDGLWFTAIEQKYGLDAALEIDEEVWQRFGAIQARRLLKNFALKEDSPIQTLMNVLQVDPNTVIYKPEIVELTDSKAVLRFTDCPPQKARIRDGRGEFPCKAVEVAYFTSYTEAVDPKIKLSCLTCPPDVHPPQYWCEWQFEI